MQKNIINRWAFRLFSPLLFGFFIYVLVLLFFNSPDQLLTRFFSIEYFICVSLCYVNFEIWRIIISVCEKKCSKNLSVGIVNQIITTLISGIIITTGLISAYFKFLVGLVSFRSELLILCSLIALTSLLYNMLHISQFLLKYQQDDIINEQERLKNEAVENWNRYQNKINPWLLYKSLEQLIGIVYHDKNQANILLSNLSDIYRKVLTDKNELIPIKNELENLLQLNKVLVSIYQNKLAFTINVNNIPEELFIVPGGVLLQVQQIISYNIISDLQPLSINFSINEKLLIIRYKQNKKLNHESCWHIEMESINKQINWYVHKEITSMVNQEGIKTIKMPLITIDEQ